MVRAGGALSSLALIAREAGMDSWKFLVLACVLAAGGAQAAKPAPDGGAEVVSTVPGASSSKPGEQLLSTAGQRRAGEETLARELARRRELDDLVATPQAPMTIVVDPRGRDPMRDRTHDQTHDRLRDRDRDHLRDRSRDRSATHQPAPSPAPAPSRPTP